MTPTRLAPRRFMAALAALAIAAIANGCGTHATVPSADGGTPAGPTATAGSTDPAGTATALPTTPVPGLPTPVAGSAPRRLVPNVLEVLPHDTTAFTQGLQFDGGRLYESRGMRGESAITEIDPETGAVVRSAPVAATYFAEGLAIVGDRAIQLTWQAGLAFVYDLATFEIVDTFRYEGEGWGLCFDGRQLVMSDGSSTLTYRDPTTFTPLRTVTVTNAGVPLTSLNELECVGTQVLANVWKTDAIVVISDTGIVTDVIDASGLLDGIDATGADVLNGVAYDPVSGTFLITGKYWPVMFDVVFEPSP